jgi:ribosomal protein L9
MGFCTGTAFALQLSRYGWYNKEGIATMWVTLTENVNSIGPAGATVEVPEGYAVNFLFPQHMAFENAGGAPKEEKGEKTSKEEREEESLAAELDGLEVIVAGKMKKGKFAKPISYKDVRSALKEMGHTVAFELIKFAPVSEPGTYECLIDFPTGFEATITVIAEALPE